MPFAYIALGANIGAPDKNIESAIRALSQLCRIVSQSSLYRTKPWGIVDQPDFCNAVVKIETDLPPAQLLKEMKNIEKQLGRTATVRWGPRAIDLDLLIYDDLNIDEPGLTVPHPHMTERAFVLAPLCEIDKTYQSELDKLPTEDCSSISKWHSCAD